MNKSIKIYVGLLFLIILVAGYLEYTKPIPIDWAPTFNERHTKPYGLKVLHQELPSLFEKGKIKNIYRTPYEFLQSKYNSSNHKYDQLGSYVNINDRVAIDEVSVKALMDYAYDGNTVFISAHNIPEYLKDSLGFRTDFGYGLSTKATLSFANKNLSNNEITFEKGIKNMYFKEIDTSTTIPLGYQKFDTDEAYTNFIKIPIGNGALLLHTQPIVFTNYHLLKNDNRRYSEGVLGYLPNTGILFDSQNKIGANLGDSRLRFIFSQPPLRWAWLLSLLALFLFILFNVKRKQRIVKVIKPLENTTLDFTKTIGNLYYETKDHSNVVHKKITYFLEHLRNEYLMDTQALDEKFIKRLALKTGKNEEDISKLTKLIIKLNKKIHCDQSDVLLITRAIESFHKKESTETNSK